MKDEAGQADIPALTFAECLKKVYHFRYKRLKSGGLQVESPDGSTKVIISSGQDRLHHSEITDFLKAFGFEYDDIERARIEIIRYDAGLEVPTQYLNEGMLASTKEFLAKLDTISYPRHKQSEETLKWMEDLFKKLDAEREAYENQDS
ncbi:MAG: hypothetical protein OXI16_03220 [Chloroflexota bacterium]|nr:hypothetical protein [Chloroflexota bacterium]